MSLISFIESNLKLSMAVGGIVIAGTAGGLASMKNPEADTSTYIFRSISDPKDNNYLEAADGKEFNEFEKVNVPFRQIINGDESYNKGNYILYYGSESCPHCTGFLFGDQRLASGNLWTKRDKMSDGTFMKAYAFTRLDEDLKGKNIKFLMYEDIPEVNENVVGDELWTLPWNIWKNTDLSKGAVKGEYIRNDKSAIEFRKIMDAAVDRFGDNAAGTPTLIIYKEGKPVIFNKDTLPGLDEKIVGEDLSDDVLLKRYIKYYYTAIK